MRYKDAFCEQCEAITPHWLVEVGSEKHQCEICEKVTETRRLYK